MKFLSIYIYKYIYKRYFTTIMEANTHLGKGSKNGPIHKRIQSNIKHETTLAN